MGPLDLVAVGLPTGNRGNLEFMAQWALDVLKKLDLVAAFQLRVFVVLHHGDIFAGKKKQKKKKHKNK